MNVKASPYKPTDRLRDMVEANSRLLMVICRFGLPLGFGNSTVKEVCENNDVDCSTFLAVVNYLCGRHEAQPVVSIIPLMNYLRNAHEHILNFSLPSIRKKLIESIHRNDTGDVSFLIIRYFDEYVEEVRLHTEYENNIIFPYCKRLLDGIRDSNFHIGLYTDHHENVTQKLNELKDIIINHYSYQNNILLVSALYDVISCEQDIVTHCAVEENLFVPEVSRMENELEMTERGFGNENDEPGDDRETDNDSDSSAPISDREREIIRYVALGYTNKEIAEKLFLSFHTVTTHRRNIAAKLQIHSTAGLAIYAILHNIIDLNEIDLSRRGEYK